VHFVGAIVSIKKTPTSMQIGISDGAYVLTSTIQVKKGKEKQVDPYTS
jgi:hypothetical protein